LHIFPSIFISFFFPLNPGSSTNSIPLIFFKKPRDSGVSNLSAGLKRTSALISFAYFN